MSGLGDSEERFVLGIVMKGVYLESGFHQTTGPQKPTNLPLVDTCNQVEDVE